MEDIIADFVARNSDVITRHHVAYKDDFLHGIEWPAILVVLYRDDLYCSFFIPLDTKNAVTDYLKPALLALKREIGIED